MMYKDYLEKNHSFDKKTMLGIFCMIIVIGGVFGFLYEYLFYFFKMKVLIKFDPIVSFNNNQKKIN